MCTKNTKALLCPSSADQSTLFRLCCPYGTPPQSVNMPAGCIHNNMSVQTSLRQQCADRGSMLKLRLGGCALTKKCLTETQRSPANLTHITTRAHTSSLHALHQSYLPQRGLKQRQPSYLFPLKTCGSVRSFGVSERLESPGGSVQNSAPTDCRPGRD